MIIEFLQLFLLLAAGHALADYPLQGQYLAMAKNRHAFKKDSTEKQWKEWPWALGSHATIHGFVVGIITGSWICAIIEFLAHGYIDDLKCAGKLTYNQDQFLHLGCKLLYSMTLTMSVFL